MNLFDETTFTREFLAAIRHLADTDDREQYYVVSPGSHLIAAKNPADLWLKWRDHVLEAGLNDSYSFDAVTYEAFARGDTTMEQIVEYELDQIHYDRVCVGQ